MGMVDDGLNVTPNTKCHNTLNTGDSCDFRSANFRIMAVRPSELIFICACARIIPRHIYSKYTCQ